MNPSGGTGRSTARRAYEWRGWGCSTGHRAILIAACLGIGACADRNATGTVPYRVPWYTVAGVVHDTDGVPVRGASVDLYLPPATYRAATTDEVGGFSFTDIIGDAILTVWKPGHEPWLKSLPVFANVELDVTLRPETFADTTDALPLGRVVRALVPHSAPPCDPVGWDAQAPCRRFTFLAPVTGTLSVTLTAQAGATLDLTIVRSSDRSYVGYSDTTYPGGPGVGAGAGLIGGQRYEVRVNAYYSSALFDLEARFSPASP